MTDHKADAASKETRHYLDVPFVEKDDLCGMLYWQSQRAL